VQGAVGVQHEQPAGGVGLQPVVPPAQAAQVLAAGLPALGVRHHVVGVGPAGPVGAAGMAAAAVAGVHEPVQRRGGPVAVGRRRPVDDRAAARWAIGVLWVGGAAAAGRPRQFGGGERRAQHPAGVDQAERQAAAVGRAQPARAERAEPGEQPAQRGGGDRLAAHRRHRPAIGGCVAGRCGLAGEVLQGGAHVQVRGHRRPVRIASAHRPAAPPRAAPRSGGGHRLARRRWPRRRCGRGPPPPRPPPATRAAGPARRPAGSATRPGSGRPAGRGARRRPDRGRPARRGPPA
jgi:hypothetical protein